MAKKRPRKAIRYTKLHDDGAIDTAVRTIESKLKLPKGSVVLVYPSGRKAAVGLHGRRTETALGVVT